MFVYVLIIGIFVPDITDKPLFNLVPTFKVLPGQCHKTRTWFMIEELDIVLSNVPRTSVLNSTHYQSEVFECLGINLLHVVEALMLAS